MKQHVLIVHNDYQLSGGEANVAENEARMLREHGHAVTMYRRDNAEIAAYGAFRKLGLAFASLFSVKTYREVRKLIRAESIDVVHVHNTVPLVSPSVYYAAWAERIPVVQTTHNYRFLCPNGVFYRDGHACEDCLTKGLFCAVRHGCYRNSRAQSAVLAGTLLLHRLLGTYRRIEAYIALTAFQKEKLSRRLPAERIYIKPNITRVGCAPIPYGEHGDAAVFFGRLDAEKGVWVLLRAFEQLRERKLVVIGSGPEEAKMRAYLEAHRMEHVTMTGQLSHEETLQHVAKARMFVMPTQMYEGLPLTVLEAFSLGTPVVGSAAGNVGAVILESGGGFPFDQTDPKALAACIGGLTQAQLEAASKQALSYAADVCDPEKNYRMLTAVYSAVQQRRKGGAR